MACCTRCVSYFPHIRGTGHGGERGRAARCRLTSSGKGKGAREQLTADSPQQAPPRKAGAAGPAACRAGNRIFIASPEPSSTGAGAGAPSLQPPAVSRIIWHQAPPAHHASPATSQPCAMWYVCTYDAHVAHIHAASSQAQPDAHHTSHIIYLSICICGYAICTL
jgi:hypothetical protein